MSRTPKFLRNEKNGRIFDYTPLLARRRDMVPVRDHDEPAPAAIPVPDGDDDGQNAELRDLILSMVDKDALEALGREHNIELDKRKAVKTLRAELIEKLGL